MSVNQQIFLIFLANNQDFAADVNVRGKFYNDVSNRSRNNQNFDGLTVNNGSTEQTTEIHSNQYGNSDARSINRNRGRNNNQGRCKLIRTANGHSFSETVPISIY